MRTVHVFDCDGVLVSSEKRYKTRIDEQGLTRIDLDYWRANQCKALELDTLLPTAEKYRDMLKDEDVFVIIATARQMRENDAEWRHIHEVLGTPQALIYRKDGDNRGGAALKLAGLRKLLNLKQFQGCRVEVYEDNISYLQNICDTLKQWGFNVEGHYIPSNQGH